MLNIYFLNCNYFEESGFVFDIKEFGLVISFFLIKKKLNFVGHDWFLKAIIMVNIICTLGKTTREAKNKKKIEKEKALSKGSDDLQWYA